MITFEFLSWIFVTLYSLWLRISSPNLAFRSSPSTILLWSAYLPRIVLVTYWNTAQLHLYIEWPFQTDRLERAFKGKMSLSAYLSCNVASCFPPSCIASATSAMLPLQCSPVGAARGAQFLGGISNSASCLTTYATSGRATVTGEFFRI